MFGNGAPKRNPKPNTQVIQSYRLKGLDLDLLQAALTAAQEEHNMIERDPKGPGMTYDAQSRNGYGFTVYGEARRPSVVTRGFTLDIEELQASA